MFERPAMPHPAERPRWMSILAKAPYEELAAAWEKTETKPAYTVVRAPETGLAMIQARMGGTGGRFNLGEMTLSRCVVQTADGRSGFGYVAGSELRHAEIAAVFDAMLQDDKRRPEILASVINPLHERHQEKRRVSASKTAATRVDFFTLVRGEDE